MPPTQESASATGASSEFVAKQPRERQPRCNNKQECVTRTIPSVVRICKSEWCTFVNRVKEQNHTFKHPLGTLIRDSISRVSEKNADSSILRRPSSSMSSDTTITRDTFLHVPSHQRSDRPWPGFSNSEASISISLSHLFSHLALDIRSSRIPNQPFRSAWENGSSGPQTRLLSEVEPDRSESPDICRERPKSKVGAERFWESFDLHGCGYGETEICERGEENKASKRKKQKHLLPKPYSHEDEDVLWQSRI